MNGNARCKLDKREACDKELGLEGRDLDRNTHGHHEDRANSREEGHVMKKDAIMK